MGPTKGLCVSSSAELITRKSNHPLQAYFYAQTHAKQHYEVLSR